MKNIGANLLKSIALAVTLISLGSQAYAGTISLTPGSSITLGDNTVVCSTGQGNYQRLFRCKCWNRGATNNPPPEIIYVRSESYATVDQDGRRACSTHNYGRPDFGYSPVTDCREVLQ